MATHEVDQKLLGLLAKTQIRRNAKLAGALYQILGLSLMLGPRLVTARRLRQDDLASMEVTKRRRLLEEIVWLTRAGLELLQEHVNPSINEKTDARLRIFAAKLRASFYHVFCLFRNDPPLTELAQSVLESYRREGKQTPMSARHGNRAASRGESGSVSKGKGRMYDKENQSKSSPPERGEIRNSIISEASYVTNPWSPPPGLPLPELTGAESADFLIPTRDYMPAARGAFKEASALAEKLLPASAPLRLSVQLERCAFLWDCAHDHEGSRKLARITIRDVYRTDAGLTDEEFEDSTQIVGTLGRMMRRKSQEGTPRFGSATPPAPRSAQSGPSTTPRDAPPLPQIPTTAPQPQSARQVSADPGSIEQLASGVATNTSRPRTTARTSPPQTRSQIPKRTDSIQRTPSPHRQQARTQRQLPPRSSPPQAPLPQPPQMQPRTPPRQSPGGSSSAGTSFLVPRKPIPPQAQGSTASPGRSNSGRTGTTQTASPGGSTAPTVVSTPRAAGSPRTRGSPRAAESARETESPRQRESQGRSSKRHGSDTGSPSRKQRSRR